MDLGLSDSHPQGLAAELRRLSPSLRVITCRSDKKAPTWAASCLHGGLNRPVRSARYARRMDKPAVEVAQRNLQLVPAGAGAHQRVEPLDLELRSR